MCFQRKSTVFIWNIYLSYSVDIRQFYLKNMEYYDIFIFSCHFGIIKECLELSCVLHDNDRSIYNWFPMVTQASSLSLNLLAMSSLSSSLLLHNGWKWKCRPASSFFFSHSLNLNISSALVHQTHEDTPFASRHLAPPPWLWWLS